MAAMAGMLLAGDRTFTSLGIGAIMVVAVAMIGSLTVVPAMLAWLGDRVDKGRVPFLHRLRRPGGESRLWGAGPARVLKRPALSAGLAAAVLIALAIPAFSMHTVQTGTDDLPRKLEVMKVYDRMQAPFPAGQIPAVVAGEARDAPAPERASAVKSLEAKAAATGAMNAPVAVRTSPDKHIALIDIPMKGDGTHDVSAKAV